MKNLALLALLSLSLLTSACATQSTNSFAPAYEYDAGYVAPTRMPSAYMPNSLEDF